jgi:hypothetical protein
VALRNRLRQLERAARDNLDWFELGDGTRFYFDPQTMPGVLFDYGSACLKADHHGRPRPAPPELLVAVTKAKDRREALAMLYTNFLPIDADVLIERGVLEHRSFTAGEEWIVP